MRTGTSVFSTLALSNSKFSANRDSRSPMSTTIADALWTTLATFVGFAALPIDSAMLLPPRLRLAHPLSPHFSSRGQLGRDAVVVASSPSAQQSSE